MHDQVAGRSPTEFFIFPALSEVVGSIVRTAQVESSFHTYYVPTGTYEKRIQLVFWKDTDPGGGEVAEVKMRHTSVNAEGFSPAAGSPSLVVPRDTLRCRIPPAPAEITGSGRLRPSAVACAN